MKSWAVGEVANRAGVPTSTIRYYEQIELLPEAERVNGRRRYDDSVLQKLGMIRLAQKAGFTLDEVQTLLHDFPTETPPSERWQVMAAQKLNELEKQLKTIQEMRMLLEQTLNCHCETMEDCGEGLAEILAAKTAV